MFFVFDVETIPDFEFIRNVMNDNDSDDDALLTAAAEQLTNNKSGFLPPMYHRIVSWVGLWIENNGRPLQQVSWSGKDEKKGIEELFDALLTYKDFGLIHHNGRGFDLPLITYRAMRHDMQMPLRLNHHDIRYRFSRSNVDLMDEFSNYGASSYPKLKHLGHLINIPFKQTGEGNEVLEMFRKDELDKIENYCHEDVMATYIVWLKMKYTTGDLPKDLYENLNKRAVNKLKEIQSEKLTDSL